MESEIIIRTMVRGYHVYYKFNNELRKTEEGEYEFIDILVQLASIVYWKQNYGPIRLIANQAHVNTLVEYGIFDEYDGIDVSMLTQMPYKEKASKYWSFSKIFVAKQLSKRYNEFCIFDTDLWIKGSNLIDKGYDFHAFHKEQFNTDSDLNMYYHESNWLDQDEISKYNWNYWPLNCAILHFKNRTSELIESWYNIASKVIESDQRPEDDINKSRNTVFIEQRMLPVIAKSLGISYGTIKPNVYQSWKYKENINAFKIWDPTIDSSIESLKIHDNITHVWASKFYYEIPQVRIRILTKLLKDLEHFADIQKKYKHLFDRAKQILELSYKEL